MQAESLRSCKGGRARRPWCSRKMLTRPELATGEENERNSGDRHAGRMWMLSADRRTVRLSIPPVRITGRAKPLTLHLECDATLSTRSSID